MPDTIEVLWLTSDGEAYAAAAQSASSTLAGLVAAGRGQQENLSKDAWLENAAKPAGDRVAAALWVDLAVLTAAAGPGLRSPLLLLLGKDAARTWLSIDASKPAIETLLRSAMGR